MTQANRQAKVSVLVPNYKTLELTKICLRLLRKNTDADLIHVIVIDNDSNDDSTQYLRNLNWIELIERPAVPGESGGMAHAQALDLGLARVQTPFVMSIHTDTFVYDKAWLEFLMKEIRKSEQIAGVGSWKLESKPWFKRMLKWVERKVQSVIFPLLGKGYGQLEGKGGNFYYLRSHCALYRTDLIRRHGLSFSQDNDTAGRTLHKGLVDQGYQMVFLPAEKLMRYILHVNHATMVLNPHLGSRQRSVSIGTKRIQKALQFIQADAILQDETLDQ